MLSVSELSSDLIKIDRAHRLSISAVSDFEGD